MSQLKTDGHQAVMSEWAAEAAKQSSLNLFFLGLLSVSFVGYAVFRETWMKLVFGHTAGLSIMAFYAGLAGLIAENKGYPFKTGYKIGFGVPVVLGVISAFLLAPYDDRNLPLTCGGWTALASGLVIVAAFALIKKKAV